MRLLATRGAAATPRGTGEHLFKVAKAGAGALLNNGVLPPQGEEEAEGHA
jgi:hypothetical protein